ncbi:MAG: hypothetical protein ACI9OJ_001247 [Myxococcota bacterium]|jgi:hypothetical protein
MSNMLNTKKLIPCAVAAFMLVMVFDATAQSKEALAQKAYQEAKAAYDAGDMAGSLAKLREAYGHLPDPKLKVSIALRLIDLDRPEEAADELRSVTTSNRNLKTLIAGQLRDLEAVLAKPVRLAVETTPTGAMVQVGEQPPQKTPFRVEMPRGLVVVTIKKVGYKTHTDNVHLRGTRPIKRSYTLEARDSRLQVELTGTSENATVPPIVTIDGNPVEPGVTITIEPGKHTIACGYPKQGPPTTVRVAVPAGKNAVVRCALPEPLAASDAWKTPVGWASVGSGAAAIAAGVGILVSYAVESSTYPEPQYSVSNSSKPVAGGVVAGIGAGLVGMGLGFLLSR